MFFPTSVPLETTSRGLKQSRKYSNTWSTLTSQLISPHKAAPLFSGAVKKRLWSRKPNVLCKNSTVAKSSVGKKRSSAFCAFATSKPANRTRPWGSGTTFSPTYWCVLLGRWLSWHRKFRLVVIKKFEAYFSRGRMCVRSRSPPSQMRTGGPLGAVRGTWEPQS